MGQDRGGRTQGSREQSTAALIAWLAQKATVEVNIRELKLLEASRNFLTADRKVYVSFLPNQTWRQTENACRAVRMAGFDPIPHIPVRLLTSTKELSRVLTGLVREAGITDALLIAGDYARVAGPFKCVADVLRSGILSDHDLHRVSVAGHPEGHPKVPLADIRRAELEKVELAERSGLHVTLVTQFFFNATPFVTWVCGLRGSGVRSPIVAGLAGPATLTTLFKFAFRCGVGSSLRALGDRPTSLADLMGDQGPQVVMRALAEEQIGRKTDFSGFHFFCFGGFIRTCEWLHQVSEGRFKLNDRAGFDC
jgi:methylenetetrahydrofolate reductase (NADPH)